MEENNNFFVFFFYFFLSLKINLKSRSFDQKISLWIADFGFCTNQKELQYPTSKVPRMKEV